MSRYWKFLIAGDEGTSIFRQMVIRRQIAGPHAIEQLFGLLGLDADRASTDVA
jgi:hypothetical protein